MTQITDEMVERGAIGLDADLFARDKYYDHPNVVRKRNDALEISRIVLTAALEGSVAVPADEPGYEACAGKLATDFQYRADGHFREDVIAACVRTIKHAMRWRDSGRAVQDALPRKDRGGAA